jgi:hypothetical protein
MSILIIQVAISSTIYFAINYKSLYIVWVCLSYFCLGGHFSVFPTACVNIFGMKIGPKVYTILFTAIGITSIFGFLTSKYLLSHIGYEIFFMSSCLMTLLSLVILIFFFDEKTKLINQKET